jgi:hypothetical protein
MAIMSNGIPVESCKGPTNPVYGVAQGIFKTTVKGYKLVHERNTDTMERLQIDT